MRFPIKFMFGVAILFTIAFPRTSEAHPITPTSFLFDFDLMEVSTLGTYPRFFSVELQLSDLGHSELFSPITALGDPGAAVTFAPHFIHIRIGTSPLGQVAWVPDGTGAPVWVEGLNGALLNTEVETGGQASIFITPYFDTPEPNPEPTTLLLLGTGLAGLAGLGVKVKLKWKFRLDSGKWLRVLGGGYRLRGYTSCGSVSRKSDTSLT